LEAINFIISIEEQAQKLIIYPNLNFQKSKCKRQS